MNTQHLHQTTHLRYLKMVFLFFLIIFTSCSKDGGGDTPTDDGQSPTDDDPIIETSIINVTTQTGDGILNFGRVYPDFNHVAKYFTVTNQSNVVINVSGISIPNSFSLSEATTFTLAPYEAREFALDFYPLTEGDHGGTVTVSSDADEGISNFTVEAISAKTVFDNDGNEYNIVRIGNQLWTLENFRGTTALNGDSLAHFYFTDPTNDALYGKLYPRDQIFYWNSSSKRVFTKPLIEGFLLPTNYDWNVLFTHLGGIDVAGGKMKHVGTQYWDSPNTGATNESGFTALPAGSYLGTLYNFGNGAKFWSYKFEGAEPYDYAYSTILLSGIESLLFQHDHNSSYYSVRLMKRKIN